MAASRCWHLEQSPSGEPSGNGAWQSAQVRWLFIGHPTMDEAAVGIEADAERVYKGFPYTPRRGGDSQSHISLTVSSCPGEKRPRGCGTAVPAFAEATAGRQDAPRLSAPWCGPPRCSRLTDLFPAISVPFHGHLSAGTGAHPQPPYPTGTPDLDPPCLSGCGSGQEDHDSPPEPHPIAFG